MPLTLDDLADALNVDAAPDPATRPGREMRRALDTAVQEVTRATGILDAATVTARVSIDRRDNCVRLPYVRLAAVGAVTDPGGTVVAPWAVDALAGLVWVFPVGWYTPLGVWSVECTGNPWPAALTTAALEWAAHLYDTQRTRTNPVDDDQPLASFALPNRVEELLRPYRLPGAA